MWWSYQKEVNSRLTPKSRMVAGLKMNPDSLVAMLFLR